ncbi:MAG: hypothetical protein A3H69_02555 [Candidatus Sungbacteria bacterium RIFCSPLOWO2_02_FULL_47_9]|uniref:Bacterial sugar transferase domain-containing protein n=1 Tax=Candidatus Sungbacteria bacterium RIFCSPHIGHO2_01_FULL_47_32 TaxID=1802264 RepID=A0A1G2K957_9BACT|nr:MAG: hypothetical protein A2633_03715 [Candidatus Sungbacteria bacterium RIFCSPHIGHO2_01_FULL_47_32]OHA06119.1 MAG: hypothetical protein A3A28_05790 [Candidatus Sungbacteria bacterium RIFCSPLOWO2_01_FULL_47_32]OHA10284.1 MAG: hypothetical protein A3H69_02555 [Candidatus Sungbacteria bacterium RIFCSPLOWO2_02_FULL_47_9]
MLALGDVIILYFSLYVALLLRNLKADDPRTWDQHFIPFTIVFALWLVVFFIAGLYELRIIKNEGRALERIAWAIGVNALLGILIFYFLPSFRITPKTTLFLTTIITSSLLFLWRIVFNAAISRLNESRVLFFGVTKETVEMAGFLKKNPQFGYEPAALMLAPLEPSHTYQNYYTGNKFSTSTQIQDDEALAELAKEEHAGNLPYPFFSSDEDLERVIKTHAIDTIVVSKNIKENKTLVRMFFDIIPYGVTIIDFPEFYENITGKIPVSLIGEVWFLEHLVEGQKTLFESAKQVTDLFLAILLALPTIAILPFLAVAIRLDSKGPIFYRQQRVSRRKKIIEIIKLRTMVADAEKDGVRWADENDMRVTRVGRFLRKTRLDELPQLWSVLKGDLSLVGPRPERPEFVEILRTEIPFYDMRLLVKPGLTGWAQVNFPYGASVEDSMEKLQYDLFYIKNRSVILDISTMLKTLLIIISRGGR